MPPPRAAPRGRAPRLRALLLPLLAAAAAATARLAAAVDTAAAPPPPPSPVLPLYHGWSSPLADCNTSWFEVVTSTVVGGVFAHLLSDSLACAAWKLAATVCNQPPTSYPGRTASSSEGGAGSDGGAGYSWYCPSSGGFGGFCSVEHQLACSDCSSSQCNCNCAARRRAGVGPGGGGAGGAGRRACPLSHPPPAG